MLICRFQQMLVSLSEIWSLITIKSILFPKLNHTCLVRNCSNTHLQSLIDQLERFPRLTWTNIVTGDFYILIQIMVRQCLIMEVNELVQQNRNHQYSIQSDRILRIIIHQRRPQATFHMTNTFVVVAAKTSLTTPLFSLTTTIRKSGFILHCT